MQTFKLTAKLDDYDANKVSVLFYWSAAFDMTDRERLELFQSHILDENSSPKTLMINKETHSPVMPLSPYA